MKFSLGHLPGVHIRYMQNAYLSCTLITLKSGFDVVRWLEGCSRDVS